MKTRNGFVSNSSSSSFIVIGDRLDYKIPKEDMFKYEELDLSMYTRESYVNGNYQFGWSFEKYDDFDSKLNFAYLQALTCGLNIELEMIYNVLKKHGINNPKHSFIPTKWDMETLTHDHAFIDHQSLMCEDTHMKELFKSEDNLEKFLFSSDSYVQTGNDNE